MPGVVVTTAVRTGPAGVGDVKASQWFVAGATERGDKDEPILVRSLSDYVTYFGDYKSGTIYTELQTYFEEGGSRAYVQRVVKGDATTASITLQDRHATTPDDTLTLTAADPGVWGNELSVEVFDGDVTDTFQIRLYLKGELVYSSNDLASPAAAVTAINTSGVKHLVKATDAGSATVAPGNNPATLAETNFTGGTDGTALVTADYTGALAKFGYELGPGAVALPGQTGATVWSALIQHARENNRIAVCAFGENETQAAAKSAVTSYYAIDGAEHTAFYYPWVTRPDPTNSLLTLNQSPEAYVCAKRARAVVDVGAWQPGAGLLSQASYVTGLVTPLTRAEGDSLDAKRINALRVVNGRVRVYGARSISSDEDNWRYITAQDTINYIVNEAEFRLDDLLFTVIDGRGALFGRIEAALVGLLDPIRQAGGLYEAFDSDGERIDPGYSVVVNENNNPAVQLAQGKVTAQVGLRVSSVGDQIAVTITKSNLSTSVV